MYSLVLTLIALIYGVNCQSSLILFGGQNHATGSTILCQGQVQVSPTALLVVQWRFNSSSVCSVTINNNVIVKNSDVCDASIQPAGSSAFYYSANSVISAELNSGQLHMNLSYNNAQYEDYLLQLKLYDFVSANDLTSPVPLSVKNCTNTDEFRDEINLVYNDETVVQCKNLDQSISVTCQSNTTLTRNGSCVQAPNPPLPGWAIFLIILGALVLVFAVLFIVWWCVPGFRECLHGVSECFPEDHCCGKGSKDINEETTQKAAQVEDDL